MNVVSCAAYQERRRGRGAKHLSHVAMQLRFYLWVDEGLSILGAGDDVKEHGREGLRHVGSYQLKIVLRAVV
jgi:hypothetical protein